MRRTRSPWFSRTSSANNVGALPSSKTSGIIFAGQSVLRLHRKGAKDNIINSQEEQGSKTNKKHTIQTSRSHLGFLRESDPNKNTHNDSSSMLRFKRKKGDRDQALPVATSDDDVAEIDARPRAEYSGRSGMLIQRHNKEARQPVPRTAVPGMGPTRESVSSGNLVVRSRSKEIYWANRNARKDKRGSPSKDPTQDSGLRLKRRREALKANLDAKASMDPTNEADNSRSLLEMRRNRLKEAENIPTENKKDGKRKTSKKALKAAMEPTNEPNKSRSLLEIRRQRLIEEANREELEEQKSTMDPTNETGNSRSLIEIRRNKHRAVADKETKRDKSRREPKSSMDPTNEGDNSRSLLEIRRNRKRAADGKDSTRQNSHNELKESRDQHHNSFGVLVRKQPPTLSPPGGNNNSNTRTQSASSRGEISGPVVKILRGRKVTQRSGGFSSDRTRSGPIQTTKTESTSHSISSRTSSRTRSGPIASSRQRGEFESQRQLRLQPREDNDGTKRSVNSVDNNVDNNNIITTGSDASSTSDDDPTSTPRNAGIAKVASPSETVPSLAADKDQSRAESMPHLRRRKYLDNSPSDSYRPRVCPVIPELPTTKSFRNSNDDPAHNEATSKSMANLRRRKNNTSNNTYGINGRRNLTNSQFDTDRAGDTPIVPSAPKSAFPGNSNHGGSSSMLRLRRLRHRKNEPQVSDNSNGTMRSDSDQTPVSPPSRYGFPSSKSTSRINNDTASHNQHESHSMLRLRRTKRLHVGANPAMLSTADASPPPPLRYSHADLRVSGWLSKKGKRLGTKVERFFTLRGCVLSNARSKGAKPSSSINVRGAKVYGGSHREIIIALPKAVVSFYAPSAESHGRWIKALQAVSSCVFDFYDKGKRIGKGAYSEVFLGRDKIRNELCAIKVLQRPDPDHGKLIDREISVLHLLNHENIVQIYDIFETTKTTYIVMEFLPGGELLDMITENDNLSELCAKHVISQLLRAISYLHMKDIVHRDIKPDNILCVGRTWPLHVKLTDFGLSKVVSHTDGSGGVMKSQCGTAFYLAPEIARNLDYGKPVDLWACGIVLYVMLAGKFPFYGDTHKEFIDRLRNGVKFPSKQWRNISPDAKDLIMCLLDPNPTSRLTADQALQHHWLVNDQEPKSTFGGPSPYPRNLQSEFNNDLQSMPAVNFKSRRGYRDKSNRSSGLAARKRVESIQDLPSFTTSVSTVGDPQSESMVFN